MKVVLLNGKIGSGKSFIGKQLYLNLQNSAFIEGDAFLQINPFLPTKENYVIVAKSIANHVKTFSQFKTIETVVISWVIWHKETFETLMNLLQDFEVFPVCLQCPENILLERVKEDVLNYKRHPDNLEKISRKIYSTGFIGVNSNQKEQAVVENVLKIINS